MDESGDVMLDNLLQEMNVDEWEKIFVRQIQNEDDDYTSPQIDNFTELYGRYTAVLDHENLDEDKLRELANRFERICKTIIACINAKFDTNIDIETICEADGNLAGTTLTLYKFFIIDILSNTTTIMRNYIIRHGNELYDTFKDLSVKKDVVTTVNQATMSKEMAVIASNIYDVTDHIFTLLDEDSIYTYCEEGYLAGALIHRLVDEDRIRGKFVTSLADLYRQNTDLRARVCFDITFAIKNGDIADTIFTRSESEEETE